MCADAGPAAGPEGGPATRLLMTNLLQDHLNGRYRLTGLLGRGGMSDVYQGVDERTGTSVAIKVVRSADPEHARRLAQEVRALERFDHPGLVRLLDSGVAGDDAFLVMELIDGPSLAQVLRRGPLSTAATARLGAGLAAALAYVHEHGIVHRDVKPGNVLIGSDGDARLGDFGIARLLDASTLTVAGTTLGTAAYMAPEQLENHVVTPAADIWSLGMVLLECLTGRRLYEGSPSEVIAQRFASAAQVPPSVPEPWRRVLAAMMDPQPQRRPGGAEVASLLGAPALAEPWEAWGPPAALDLAAGRLDETQAAPPASATRVDPRPPARQARTRTRARALVAVVAAGVCAALVGILVAGAGGNNNAAQRSTTTARPPTSARPASATSAPPTTAAPSFAALGTLQRDLAAGVAAGTITPSTSSAVGAAAQRAVAAAAVGGGPGPVAGDLQAASKAVTQGVNDGSVSPAEAATVLRDLAALAATLGVATAPPPPTAPPPHPPHKNGKHHGH